MIARTAILITAFTASSVGAEEVMPWQGEAELGAVVTSGNTKTQTINAKGKVVNNRESWKHTLTLEALNNASDEETTAERYLAAFQSDYKMSDLDYLFVLINYEDDRFSGFDYQVSEALGYGRKIINRPDLALSVEGGPGARQTKLEDGDSDNEFMFRLGGFLTWKLSEQAVFGQVLTSDIGEDITITKSITSLKAQVANNLAMKVTCTAKHTSDVPPDTKKTDGETALTLVYNF